MDSLNLKLSSPEFVGFAVKILYEMIHENKIRYLFLFLLSKIIINSDYNKSFISSNHITEKLFFLIRVEQNQEIRNFVSETLYEIIKDFAKVIKKYSYYILYKILGTSYSNDDIYNDIFSHSKTFLLILFK